MLHYPSIEPNRPQKTGGRYVGNHERIDVLFARSCLINQGGTARQKVSQAFEKANTQHVSIQYLADMFDWLEVQFSYLIKHPDLVERYIDGSVHREKAYKVAVGFLMGRSLTSSVLVEFIENYDEKVNELLNQAFAYMDTIQASVWDSIESKDKITPAHFFSLFKSRCRLLLNKFRKEFQPCAGSLDRNEFFNETNRGTQAIKTLSSAIEYTVQSETSSPIEPEVYIDILNIHSLKLLLCECMAKHNLSGLIRYLRTHIDELKIKVKQSPEWRAVLFCNRGYLKDLLPCLLNKADLKIARFLLNKAIDFSSSKTVFKELYEYVATRYQATYMLGEARLERIREGEVLKILAEKENSLSAHIDNIKNMLRVDVRAVFAYIEGMVIKDYNKLLSNIEKIKFGFELAPDNQGVSPYLFLKSCGTYHRAEEFALKLIATSDDKHVTEESVNQYVNDSHNNSSWKKELNALVPKVRAARADLAAQRQNEVMQYRSHSETKILAALGDKGGELRDHLPATLVNNWIETFQKDEGMRSVYAGRYLCHLATILSQSAQNDEHENSRALFFAQLLDVCRIQLGSLLAKERVFDEKAITILSLMEKIDLSYQKRSAKKGSDQSLKESIENTSPEEFMVRKIPVNTSTLVKYVNHLEGADLLSQQEQEQHHDALVKTVVTGAACSMVAATISGVGLGLAWAGIVTGIIATAIPFVAAALFGAALLAWVIVFAVQKAKQAQEVKSRKAKLLEIVQKPAEHKTGPANKTETVSVVGTSVLSSKRKKNNQSVKEMAVTP